MTTPSPELAALSPAEVDALWADAAAPGNALRARRADLISQARRYEKFGGVYAEQGAGFRQRAADLDARIEEADVAVAPFAAEWDRRGGWTRAYLVPDGHIHRSTACPTLHPTTLVSWLPEQSGWDEDRIVEAAGVHACTVCYPSAPVEALRAAAAAEKAAGECSGSRSYSYDSKTWRRTSHTGSGRATCSVCGQAVGTTTTGRLRAHKKEA